MPIKLFILEHEHNIGKIGISRLLVPHFQVDIKMKIIFEYKTKRVICYITIGKLGEGFIQNTPKSYRYNMTEVTFYRYRLVVAARRSWLFLGSYVNHLGSQIQMNY